MPNLITGIPELDSKLQSLATRTARKAARSALGKGMTVLKRRMKALAPRAATPGHSGKSVKQSIGSRQRKNRRAGISEAVVGIDVGKKRADQRPQAHLLATGTVQRTRKRVGGKFAGRAVKSLRTGKLRGNNFIGVAYAASAGESLSAMLRQADTVIQREAAR